MEEKKKDSGFVVKDKRHFGESAEEKPQEEIKTAAAEDKKEKSRQAPDNEDNYPPVNFTNFVLSLSTSALFHFGDFAESEGAAPQKNLPAVKQTIDILDMLNEKTKGNLDQNESSLIQGILYELKMRYVKEKV
ncbi:MAG: DUF1844 domain-containing protein [Deltaproteobacteria bacterium]|nr:DUF1844 domain-containing protein [Deltaproteobacteria bacterium]